MRVDKKEFAQIILYFKLTLGHLFAAEEMEKPLYPITPARPHQDSLYEC
jgi:hypothetical protein